MTASGPDTLNGVVLAHEINADWDYRPIARTLSEWMDRFNRHFFEGELPTLFLRFETERTRLAVQYQRGRNSVGALHQINMNPRQLARPVHDVLATLLHGMAHEWQDLYGKPARNAFHNRQIVARCAQMGVPCEARRRCATVRYEAPFVSLLEQHGVAVPSTQPTPFESEKAPNRMKRWTCGCKRIARYAGTLNAVCLTCNQPFVLLD